MSNERKKALARGNEKLLGLGGFIADQIKRDAYDSYKSAVIKAVDNHISYGPGFWEVADATEAVSESLPRRDQDFRDWVLDNVARLETDRYRSGKGYFWKEWNVSVPMASNLSKLNALDERILSLSLGLDNGKEMTKEEIAVLSEFDCPVDYIDRVLGDLEEVLMSCKYYLEEKNMDCGNM